MNKKVDIYFIAEKANVSPATVSRVFNNADIVTKKTKDRVIEVCKKYNYRPSSIARSMRTKRTHYIGFVMPNMVNPFFYELLQGADNFAGSKDYYLVLFNSENNYQKEMAFLDQFLIRNIDGIIISGIAGGRKDNLFAREVLKRGIPSVLVDRYIEGLNVPSVITDNYKGGILAAKYLIDMGHKNIGIISYGRKVRIIEDRYQGFKKELKDNNIREKFFIEIPVGSLDLEKEFEAGKDNFLNKEITAVFCISDFIAINFIQYLKNLHIKVPGQVSVIGFDNINISSLAEPKLTTIAQDIYRMGKLAAALLIDKIRGEDKKDLKKVLEPKLLERNSVKKIVL